MPFPTSIHPQTHFHTSISEVCTLHSSPPVYFSLPRYGPLPPVPDRDLLMKVTFQLPSPTVTFCYYVISVSVALATVDSSVLPTVPSFLTLSALLASFHLSSSFFPSFWSHMSPSFLIHKKFMHYGPQVLIEVSGARMSGCKARCAISKCATLGKFLKPLYASTENWGKL